MSRIHQTSCLQDRKNIAAQHDRQVNFEDAMSDRAETCQETPVLIEQDMVNSTSETFLFLDRLWTNQKKTWKYSVVTEAQRRTWKR